MALLKDGTRVFGTLNVNTEIVVDNTSILLTLNTVFDQSNTVGIIASAGFDKANSANIVASAAFDKANSANVVASSAFDKANSANIVASSAFDQANSANVVASSAFDQANTANVIASASFDKANSANIVASSAFDQANTANVIASAAFDKANSANIIASSAFDKANSANVVASSAFDQANTANVIASSAFDQANTANVIASAAFDQANSANIIASSAFDKANSANIVASAAYDQANSANVVASSAFDQANTANVIASAAFDKANSANIVASSAFDQANTANVTASAAFDKANNANIIASAAFDEANLKLNSSGSAVFTGDLTITGNLTVSGNQTYYDIDTYRVSDPLIYLAANNYTSDVVDIGFIANYVNTTGSNVHTGLIRDHLTKEYYLFFGYDKEPDNNHVDPTGNNFTIAFLNSNIRSSNIILSGVSVYDWVQSSFNKANTANVIASSAFDKANSANIAASAAYDQANTANVIASAAFDKANSANVIASAAFDKANTANVIASAAFDKANSANVIASAAFDQANTANVIASAAFDQANTANVIASSAFDKANTANVIASAAYDKANTANVIASSAFDKANSANVIASSAFDKANSANVVASSAFDKANTANVIASAAFDQANTANVIASAAFDQANTANVIASNAFDKANTANVIASLAFDKANTANVIASLAFDKANTANIIASAAFDKANTANVIASAAFDQANSAKDDAALAETIGLGAFAKANGAAQLAFGTVVANGTSLVADSNNDILTILTTGNVSITADASGDNLTFDLTDTGVAADTYGNNTIIPTLTVDSKGRIKTVSNTNVNLPIQKLGTIIGSRKFINFIEGNANVTIDVIDDSAGDRVNVTISTTGGGGGDSTIASAAFDKANSANIIASAAFDKANSANIVASAAFDKANSAAQLAFGTVVANGTSLVADSNNDTLTILTTGNVSIVGNATGDNLTFDLTTTGVAAATYGSSTIVPVFVVDSRGRLTSVTNTTIDTTIATAAFAKANGAAQLAFGTVVANGTSLVADSNNDTLTIRTTGNVAITADAGGDNLTFDLTTTGVTAATYGSSTIVPVFVVDSRGRLTSVTNTTIDTTIATAAFAKANGAAQLAFGTVIANGTSLVADSNNDILTIRTTGNVAITADAAGDNLTFDLTDTGVSAGIYGNSTIIPIVTVDSKGRLITISNTNIDVSNKLNTSGGVITGDLTITGNLTVSGNQTFYDIDTYRISDPLIYLAANNYTSDVVDIGFIANYVNTTGSNVHTGLIRDHQTKEYYLFFGYDKEPDFNHIDPTGNNFTIAFLNSNIRSSNIILSGVSVYDWIQSSFNKANGAAQNAFGTIVANGVSLVADSNNDTLTIRTTGNVSITADAAGDNLTFDLTTTGVTASVYGSATIVPVITVDSRGRLTSVTNTTIDTTIATAAFSKANGAAQLAFGTIIANGTSLVADSNNDTLTIRTTGNVAITADATGDNLTFDLTTTGVTAATYGSSTIVPVFVVDSRGRLTSVTNTTIDTSIATAAFAKANGAAQNAFGTVVANGISLVADSNNDTLTIRTTGNVSITADATGDNLTFDLTTTGVTAATYGSSTIVPVFVVDSRGRLTSVTNTTIDTTIATAAFAKANGAAQNAFGTIVANGISLVADSNNDTLTILTAGNVAITADAGGDNLTFDLTTTGVTAATYGSASIVPVLTVDSRGRITSVTNTTISATADLSSVVLKTGNTMTGNLVMSGANIAFATATNSGIYWSGTSFIHSPAANVLVLGTSSVEDMRITSDGKVGIGTSSPQANLHISSTNSGQTKDLLILANPASSSVNTAAQIKFYVNGGGDDGYYSAISSVQSTAGNFADLRFFTSEANEDTPSIERMRITAEGDINLFDNELVRPQLVDYSLKTYELTTTSGSITVNLELANYFYVSSPTGTRDWTFSNPPTGSKAGGFILRLTNAGEYTQNWPITVDWPGGTAPTLTTSGVDILVFITDDGGTTWRGVASMLDSK